MRLCKKWCVEHCSIVLNGENKWMNEGEIKFKKGSSNRVYEEWRCWWERKMFVITAFKWQNVVQTKKDQGATLVGLHGQLLRSQNIIIVLHSLRTIVQITFIPFCATLSIFCIRMPWYILFIYFFMQVRPNHRVTNPMTFLFSPKAWV